MPRATAFRARRTRDGISLVAYIHAMFGLLRQAGSKTVLMIGCGGGTLATMLANVGCKLTVVDIDPHAFLLARRYFRFPPDDRLPRGRRLRVPPFGAHGTFDAVVLDAFMAGDIPDSSEVVGVLFAGPPASHSGRERRRQCPRRERSGPCRRTGWRARWRRCGRTCGFSIATGTTHRNAILMAGGVRDLRKPDAAPCARRWTATRLSPSWRQWHFAPGAA